MSIGPIGIRAKAKADNGAKIRMYGMRRPNLVRVLSLIGPMMG
jgi:hypothetical protein